MADRDLIEKYKLSEAVKRFQQINEYTFISAPPLTEDGEEEQNKDENQQQSQQGTEDTNARPIKDGGQGVQQSSIVQNGNVPLEQQAPMQPQGGEERQIPIDVPQESQQPMEDETSQMQSGDEVIDVDDLTDSQEETEEKVDGVNTKLLRLFKVVSKYTDAIEKQNQEIEDLKAEFEKRNPTEEERLNLRSQAGYPYSEQPKDYWDKKTKENPNYNIMYNNNVSTDKEQEKFEIKRKDLDGMNYKEIADSFDKYPQELTDYINF